MSVINRIEISNFLNLDNRNPSEQQWIPHWRHVVINLRGLSTAVIATNGVGKSTANKAIYAILTRDRTFTRESRERAAPKRRGLWSHVRIEILYKDVSELIQPGLIGDSVRGEAYVIGFYGFCDGLHFYRFNGHLEDCPVANVDGHLRKMISNVDFLAKLKGCPRVALNVSIPDWKNFIDRNFDSSLTHQLVNYQKAGGGDGAENFFKVNRDTGEDYDSAFFYAHIAPEVLVNCMDVFGEEGEYRFEDTLLESARPVLSAQRKAEQRAAAVKDARLVFEGLQAVKEKADAYLTTQNDLAQTIAASLGEASFLQLIVEQDPVFGIPLPLRTQGPETIFIADRLVCTDGIWRLPDKVIAEILGIDAKQINQEARDKQLPSTTLRAHQVLEKPTNHGSLERWQHGGQPNSGYGREAALALVEDRKRFADGWSVDKAKRAINYAFDWQTTAGESNPLRSAANKLLTEQTQLKSSIEIQQKRKIKCSDEYFQVQASLQNIHAAETALSNMRNSCLFSAEELANPIATEITVFSQHEQAFEARETHNLRHAVLQQYRTAYDHISREFPNRKPEDVHDEFIQKNALATAALHRVKEELETKTSVCMQIQNDSERARNALIAAETSYAVVNSLLPKVRRFEELFPGECANGLQALVVKQCSEAEKRIAALDAIILHLHHEEQELVALLEDVKLYDSRFSNEMPYEVASSVARNLETAYALEADIIRRSEEKQAKLAILNEGLIALRAVFKYFGVNANADIPILERKLANEMAQRTGERNALLAEIDNLVPLAQALETFKLTFGNVEKPHFLAALRAERLPQCGRELDYHKQKLESLQRQRKEVEKGRATAGSIAQEVLRCVGETLPRVHQIIEGLKLSPIRRAMVFTHFSHVLHAPVFMDLKSAHKALRALDGSGLEALIFYAPELIRFCHQGELTDENGLTYSFIIGAPTLQVRALIDPAAIAILKASIEAQLDALGPQVDALEHEYSDISPDSDTSRLIRQACTAYERQAPSTLGAAREKLNIVDLRLRKLEELLSDKNVLLVRSANEFLLDGGEATLLACGEDMQTLEEELRLAQDQLPRLQLRASAESVQWITAACRFLDKGGQPRLSEIRTNKMQHQMEQEGLANQLPVLQNRARQLPTIEAAEDFLSRGGWDWVSTTAKELEEKRNTDGAMANLLREIKSNCNDLNAQRSSIQEEFTAASSRLMSWAPMLNNAKKYLDLDGIAFDQNYEELTQRLQDNVNHAIKRTRFDFKLAKQAVNDICDPNGRTLLIERRDYLQVELAALEQDIVDSQNRINDIAEPLDRLKMSAIKMDQSVIGILKQWGMVRNLLEVIPSDLVSGSQVESIYLQGAKASLQELSEQANGEDLYALAEQFDSLASDISNFPLNHHRTQVNHLGKQLAKEFSDLARELDRVKKNHVEQLSITEQEALASDRSPQAVVKDAGLIYRHFENYLVNMERLHGQSEADLREARERLITSISSFTDGLAENFKLLKSVLDRRDTGGMASLRIAGELIDRDAIKEEIDGVVRELDLQQRRRDEDIAAGKKSGSNADFEEKLKQDIRATFYRAVFRAPNDSNASGPTVTFQHPEIAGGRPQRLSHKLSTGQGNALALLILTKLADFTLHRDAMADAAVLDLTRRVKPSATRMVMIDGLFSNLSNKKMIRHSLSVIRTLKGSFQLIGWIHNELYENDPTLFPSYCALRRVGGERGFVLVDEAAPEAEIFQNGEVTSVELHVDQLRE